MEDVPVVKYHKQVFALRNTKDFLADLLEPGKRTHMYKYSETLASSFVSSYLDMNAYIKMVFVVGWNFS